MRQCMLWYVLLLLFYSWVMPDTLHRESISSIFLCSLTYWITVKTKKNALKGKKIPPFLLKNLHISEKNSNFAAKMVVIVPLI